MLSWARRLLHRTKSVRDHSRGGRGPGGGAGDPGETAAMRWGLFDAANTHRLNKGHWQGVTGRTINLDLAADLETIRRRARFEIVNNPTAAGIIHSHTVDVVGENGPTLQVKSDNERYDKALEALWRDWWAMPDLNGCATVATRTRRCWACRPTCAPVASGGGPRIAHGLRLLA